MLVANYILYLLGLQKTTPANAQVIIQLAPALLAMGGIILFNERYNRRQWLGFLTLLIGLILFFNDQLAQIAANIDNYQAGILMIVASALVWAVYALTQKQLLNDISSLSVMTFIYIFASLILFPVSKPESLMLLTTWQWWVVIFCSVNTLVAYSAFAEALDHWEASRVSAVLALTPLGTIATAALLHHYWPNIIAAENIDITGWLGTALVICGSIVTAISGSNKPRKII